MKSFRMFWAKFDCKQEHLPTYVLCRYWMVWQMYLMGLKTCILGLSLILVMRWASAGMTFLSNFFTKYYWLQNALLWGRENSIFCISAMNSLWSWSLFLMVSQVRLCYTDPNSTEQNWQFVVALLNWGMVLHCGDKYFTLCASPLDPYDIQLWWVQISYYCIINIRTLSTHFIHLLALITWIWSSKRGPNSTSSFTHWPN